MVSVKEETKRDSVTSRTKNVLRTTTRRSERHHPRRHPHREGGVEGAVEGVDVEEGEDEGEGEAEVEEGEDENENNYYHGQVLAFCCQCGQPIDTSQRALYNETTIARQ